MMTPYDREASMAALLRALPYIRLFRGRTFVVKLGGGVCGEPALLRTLAEQWGVLRELGIRLVLVHGGGAQATALCGGSWESRPAPWRGAASPRPEPWRRW